MKIVPLIFFLLTSSMFNPLEASEVSKKICFRNRAELLDQFRDPENRIAFENGGGLMNGGVCWWHSRLQRSSIYLARFAPDQIKPTTQEVRQILRNLIHFRKMVEIPGYPNFEAFTRDQAGLVQEALNEWQIRDGFLNQQWIRGISGRSQLAPPLMEKRMNRLFEEYLKAEPGLWVMVQMRGIVSHALLVLDMVQTEHGYQLQALDSNFPGTTLSFTYEKGDSSLFYGDTPFVPYAGFRQDQLKINQTLEEYCGS